MLTHIFEAAGLGQAPFRHVRHDMDGGCCEFCGTHLVYRFHLIGADGRKFFVGSECVKKTGDAGMYKSVMAARQTLESLRALVKAGDASPTPQLANDPDDPF